MKTRFILPKIKIALERWKWNEQFNIYVSTLGHFKDEFKNDIPVKISKNNGYVIIPTAIGNEFAHRLVMKTWKPIQETEMTVDHINHNKRDNSLKNLEWVTARENTARAIRDLSTVNYNVIEHASWFKMIQRNGKVKYFTTFKQMVNYAIGTGGFKGQRDYVETQIIDCIVNKKSWAGCRWYAY